MLRSQGLVYSFPCRSPGDGTYEIVRGCELTPWLQKGMERTEKELADERDCVQVRTGGDAFLPSFVAFSCSCLPPCSTLSVDRPQPAALPSTLCSPERCRRRGQTRNS